MFNVKSSNRFIFIATLSLLFGSVLLGGLLQAMFFNINIDQQTITTVSLAGTQILLVLGPALIYLLTKKGFLKNSLFLKAPGLVNALMAILLTWLLYPLVALLNAISMFFVQNHLADTMSELTKMPFLISLIIISIFPGIFEELSTRFIILNNYRYKPYYVACLMSGLFFGLIHLNINQFIYAFVLGTIFAFMLQITESIFTTMIMHVTLNATSFTTAYFSGALAGSEIEKAMEATQQVDFAQLLAILGINVITIPLCLLIISFLIKYNGKSGILKSKPTVMELTLGHKLPEITNPDTITTLYDQDNRPVQIIPNQEYYQQHPEEPIPDPIACERYLTKFHSPFDWAFWSMICLFVIWTILLEIIIPTLS